MYLREASLDRIGNVLNSSKRYYFIYTSLLILILGIGVRPSLIPVFVLATWMFLCVEFFVYKKSLKHVIAQGFVVVLVFGLIFSLYNPAVFRSSKEARLLYDYIAFGAKGKSSLIQAYTSLRSAGYWTLYSFGLLGILFLWALLKKRSLLLVIVGGSFIFFACLYTVARAQISMGRPSYYALPLCVFIGIIVFLYRTEKSIQNFMFYTFSALLGYHLWSIDIEAQKNCTLYF